MKKEKVPFEVTFMSCVGIGSKNYPLSFGNYCGLGKYYCVNMWAENIKVLNMLMPKFKEVEIAVFDNLCFVTDENVPKEWRSSFCLTGSGGTLSKHLKEILEFAGKSFTNYICGCEKEDQSPSISQSYSYIYPQTAKNHCDLCNRAWDIEEEK